MTFSDETLMAYADGELDEPQRGEVERALRTDPALAAAVERHRALRRKVYGAYAGVLDEPVPGRLQSGAPGKVLSLDAARNARARSLAAPAPGAAPRSIVWPRWTALAASLVVGVLAGSFWFGEGDGDAGYVSADANGRLAARGQLAGALSRQLASDPAPNSPVRIGVSFATRDGGYCRSFSVGSSAGLACRSGDSWRIPVLSEAVTARGAYRQASSTMPEAVLDAIDDRIAGSTMNAAAERAARERGMEALIRRRRQLFSPCYTIDSTRRPGAGAASNRRRICRATASTSKKKRLRGTTSARSCTPPSAASWSS